jgi:hypothetical protein
MWAGRKIEVSRARSKDGWICKILKGSPVLSSAVAASSIHEFLYQTSCSFSLPPPASKGWSGVDRFSLARVTIPPSSFRSHPKKKQQKRNNHRREKNQILPSLASIMKFWWREQQQVRRETQVSVYFILLMREKDRDGEGVRISRRRENKKTRCQQICLSLHVV